MKDLEVRQLRYFVAVAEDLHFGRAAARLDMAQPPLSRAIRDLERLLGVQLLERTTRHVSLTAAGDVLLQDARIALDAVAAAGRRASNAGRSVPTLRLALKADYDMGLLPRMLAAYEQQRGALAVELVLGGLGDQVLALRDGRADVALVPTPFEAEGLDSEPVLTEERVVALAANDPLAARSLLRLSDLEGRVLPDGSAADAGVHATPYEGRPGEDHLHRLDLAQIFNLVELGSIVWFPPSSIALRHHRPGVAYRPVSDLPSTTLTLAWPAESRSRAVARFVRAAAGVVAETESGPVDSAERAPAVSVG